MSSEAGLARGSLSDRGLTIEAIAPSLEDGTVELLMAHPRVTKTEALGEIQPAPPKARGGEGQQIYRDNVSRVALVLRRDKGSGSGILVSDKGRFLTNFHVVKGERQVMVFMHPGEGATLRQEDGVVAQVIAYDTERDLALIEVKSPITDPSPVKLAAADPSAVGSEVYAIGHPLNLLWSFTSGIISQVRPGFEWAAEGSDKFRATVIQTQTPINPGNSGGPLFNASGEVIGVNSFIQRQADGLNFAVAISEVQSFLEDPKPLPEAHEERKPNPPPRPGGAQDFDGNGQPDAYGYDRRGDGRNDTWLYDRDGDGAADAIGLDLNGNGVPDTLGYDLDGDGIPDLYRHDSNEDGVFDVEGLDRNGDGRIDSVRPISLTLKPSGE